MSIRAFDSCGCCDEQRWRRVVSRRRFLAGTAALALGANAVHPSIVAARQEAATPGAGGRLRVGAGDVPMVNGSFINPLVEIYGDIEIGQRSYVAGNTILYAADGFRVSIGDENNAQDNVYILANAAETRFAETVSIAHHAVIEDSIIGAFTFFGFRCRVRNAVIEEGAMVMHNVLVEGVTIPADRITPIGARITTQAQADALPMLEEANVEFKEEVQSVNLEFVTGYTQLFEQFGRPMLEGVGPNPVTSWNPALIEPTIGGDVHIAELVRVVGDVRLGDGSVVGQRTSIRADEGTPIAIGRGARIGSRTTFHALKGTSIEIGENATIHDGNVIHGPLVVGNNLTTDDDVVLFRATVEDNVTIRTGATVAAEVVLREGTIVPEGTVVTSQEEADSLPRR